jgi:cytochrome o ubiquinol oxidase operon protein cyoD
MSKAVVSRHKATHLSLRTYINGYVASIFLTVTAYLSVTHQLFSTDALPFVIAILALIQAAVQLIFFLHLGNETKPRWKLGVFWFMLGVVALLVGGSLWIMNNLNYHHPTAAQERQYLHDQDGL